MTVAYDETTSKKESPRDAYRPAKRLSHKRNPFFCIKGLHQTITPGVKNAVSIPGKRLKEFGKSFIYYTPFMEIMTKILTSCVLVPVN